MKKKPSSIDVDDIVSNKIQLYPHQEVVADYLMKNRGLYLVYSTGTGKTLSAAGAIKKLLKSKVCSDVVVLVKKSAVQQFNNEIDRYWPQNINVLVSTETSFFSKHIGSYKNNNNVFLVVDEMHEFRSTRTKSVNNLISFAHNHCNRVLLLSATPFVNELYDIVPAITLCNNEYPTVSKKVFEKDPIKYIQTLPVSVYLIDKNSDKNYPSLTEKIISLKMYPETHKLYNDTDAGSFYINYRKLGLGKIDDASTSSRKHCIGKEDDNVVGVCEKCDFLKKKIPKWIQKKQGKILIFSSFLDTGLEKIKDVLHSINVRFVTIDGSSSGTFRRDAASQFNIPLLSDEEKRRRQKLIDDNDVFDLIDVKEKKKGSGCGDGNVFFRRLSFPSGKNEKGTQQYKYVYKDVKGKTIHKLTEEQMLHLHETAIPPPWTPTDICKENSKILWTSVDLQGNNQTRYSHLWSLRAEHVKVTMMSPLNKNFVFGILNQMRKHLLDENDFIKAHATASMIMFRLLFRVGSKEVNSKNKIKKLNKKNSDDEGFRYGTTTLLNKHVTFDKDMNVHFKFVGKSGKTNVGVIKWKEKAYRELIQSIAYFKSFGEPADDLFSVESSKRIITADSVRKYLKELSPILKPKMFRTLMANYYLLNYLKKKVRCVHWLKPSERRKYLRKSYEFAAQKLNNTRAVAKSSYIFTGFSLLFELRPRRFDDLVRKAKNALDVCSIMIREFESNRINWKLLLDEKQQMKDNVTNSSMETNVCLISDAGAASIDLKGIRHVVLLNSNWHVSIDDQIIGRAQRYRSHNHLPTKDRNVTVWRLFLECGDKSKNSPNCSIDRYVYEISKEKQNEIDEAIDVLKQNSIY